MKLQDTPRKIHTIQGDASFIKSRKLDLVVPPPEIPQALQTDGYIFLMIQPLDTQNELISEEQDSAAFRSKLSNGCPLEVPQERRLRELLHKYCACFEKRNTLPPERVPGESFKIQIEPGTHPVHRNYYRTTVFATAIGEGNGLGIAPDWLARSRIESDWSVPRDPGQRGA